MNNCLCSVCTASGSPFIFFEICSLESMSTGVVGDNPGKFMQHLTDYQQQRKFLMKEIGKGKVEN
jgi:hypothetical protein